MSFTDLSILDLNELHALKEMLGPEGRKRIEAEIRRRSGSAGNPPALKLPKRSSVPVELSARRMLSRTSTPS